MLPARFGCLVTNVAGARGKEVGSVLESVPGVGLQREHGNVSAKERAEEKSRSTAAEMQTSCLGAKDITRTLKIADT